METKAEDVERPSGSLSCSDRCRVVLKLVIGILVSLLMTSSLVLNKLSLVWLLGGTHINNLRLETWYAAFALVLLYPELFALIKVFWNTSFIKKTKTHQWPSGIALFVGFLVSFSEVASFMVFTLEVAPRLPIQVLLPVMSAVFAVGLCYEQWEGYRAMNARNQAVKYDGNFTMAKPEGLQERESPHTYEANWKRVLKTVIGFSGVWSTCAIAGIVALTSALPWFQALCLPTCLLILSLAWSPKVQVYIVKSHEDTFLGRWKATALYTVFKIIILIVGFSIIMVIRMRESVILNANFYVKLTDGLYGCYEPVVFYPLLIHFSSTAVAHVMSFVATTLCMPILGMTLPSIIATPLAILLGILVCSASRGVLDPLICTTGGLWVWCAFGLAAMAWLAPLLIKGKDLNRNSGILLKPMEELFIQPTFNSVFLDQHFILNYKYDGFTCKAHVTDPARAEKSRVFICTTMYREAEFEMARLLSSLHKISATEKLKHVYLEAHIFLDNGVSDNHVTEFATQMISLLHSKMEVSLHQGNELLTPYGLQLNWVLPGGMPFFIHLKDSTKVKSKKRWSQVMYMAYILNYRLMRDISKDIAQGLIKGKHNNADDSLYVGYASDQEWRTNTATLTKNSDDSDTNAEPEEEFATINNPSTPYYLRENKRYLKTMLDRNPDLKHFTEPRDSSDQGFFTGVDDDEVDDDSDSDSSDGHTPPRSLRFQDDTEPWPDYEGDTSSCADASFVGGMMPPIKIVDADGNETYEYSETFLDNSVTVLRLSSTNLARPVGPPPPPPPQKFPASSNRSWNYPEVPARSQGRKISSKMLKARRPVNHQDSRAQLIRQDSAITSEETGHVNLGYEDETDTEAIPKVENIKPKTVFSISKKTVPSMRTPQLGRMPLDDHTYILATDADMAFNEDSLIDLLKLCNHDRRLGGACGRTHPIGQSTGPLVWYQKFEYAKDFWMIKSSQNVIGSVMCCPGCFSLYRASAVRDVIPHYAGPTEQPFDVFIKDTGEDRWMCTLMMLRGWKLEYNAFCDNSTFCPDTFEEFMKQRRRWVLSDMANMLLVFKNIFKLAQKNDNFSLAYIFYMLQMFIIVLLSPASTIVILAGGLDIVYGIPFEIIGPVLGLLVLLYSLVCIVGSIKLQCRLSLVLTLILGLMMLSIVVGGSVYVVQDINEDVSSGTVEFQEYYLILLLIASLVYAAIIHPKECPLLAHGISYLVGFPAMQVLLPIYAICNIVDQSWGTRDNNKSKKVRVSCFNRKGKKYHKTLSRKSRISTTSGAAPVGGIEEVVEVESTDESEDVEVECTADHFHSMLDGNEQQIEEHVFWERMHEIVLGKGVNLGLDQASLASGLRNLRNICLLSLLILNALWLVLLSVFYFNANFNLVKLNVYGLITGAVYGLVLAVQVVGMTVHRVEALFTRYAVIIFGHDRPIWINKRTA
ncbi:uncharacterized protein LOC106178970 [Lingula anatina]|uniref:chitin synthase n=1 Tax=Lingula anatina TaxID=7574 RepID=A0A1S3K602_LINAN|nr:uncharacterized protein LOC106178970 [Lingula anatina]|eukprot:XP_013417859.1 uncharacterized protein LOC106178970 [Lingula anatina]